MNIEISSFAPKVKCDKTDAASCRLAHPCNR